MNSRSLTTLAEVDDATHSNRRQPDVLNGGLEVPFRADAGNHVDDVAVFGVACRNMANNTTQVAVR